MNTYYRIYPNLSRSAVLNLTDIEVKEVEAYNRRYRPGCAQFLNDRCIYRGYLTVEQARALDPTIPDMIDGVTVEQALSILRSDTEVELPKAESPSGMRKPVVRAILG